MYQKWILLKFPQKSKVLRIAQGDFKQEGRMNFAFLNTKILCDYSNKGNVAMI